MTGLKSIFLIGLVALFSFFLVFFFRGSFIDVSINFVSKFNSQIFSKLSGIRLYISGLDNINRLNRENLNLKKEKNILLAQLAALKELEDENEFLRQALGISGISSQEIIQGSVFNINFISGDHSLLLNKGEKSGVSKDNIIISSEGIFIGVVNKVFNNYSKVNIVTNPDFKATVRVLDSRVAAIAKGALNDGLYLDFVSQEDSVKEGDLVVTSGDDLIPSGLIIGRVNLVKIDETSLFKEVRVHPLVRDIDLSKVLIIKL